MLEGKSLTRVSGMEENLHFGGQKNFLSGIISSDYIIDIQFDYFKLKFMKFPQGKCLALKINVNYRR
jgi:hypothetical protein